MRTKLVGFLFFFGAAFACSSSDNAGPADDADAGNVQSADAGPDSPKPGDAGPDGDGAVLSPVHYVGRVDKRDAAGVRFSWPGTQIRARFSGTAATMHLHDEGSDQFEASIDGAAPQLITNAGADMWSLATGLPDGEHEVVVTKRTESSVGYAQFFEITSAESRPLVPTPAPFTRHVEFIGDSITCGYGVLGANENCSFSPDTENESSTYAALTAKALNAGHTAIAYSGIGVYRNNGGSTVDQMPVRYARTLAEDASSTWDYSIVPDVIVVNLGTNDYATGNPDAPFVTAYTTFLADLRTKYPAAQIVAALSPMLTDGYPVGETSRTNAATAINAVVTARHDAGDTKVSYFEFDEQVDADGYGCDKHPSATTHQKMSDKLVPQIKTLTGW